MYVDLTYLKHFLPSIFYIAVAQPRNHYRINTPRTITCIALGSSVKPSVDKLEVVGCAKLVGSLSSSSESAISVVMLLATARMRR